MLSPESRSILESTIAEVIPPVPCKSMMLHDKDSSIFDAVRLMGEARRSESLKRAADGFDPLKSRVDVPTGAVLLVNNKGKLTGIATYRDLIKFLQYIVFENAENAELLQEIATENPYFLYEDSTVSQMLYLMTNEGGTGFRHIPVIDNLKERKPIGILQLKDAMQLVIPLMEKKPTWNLGDMKLSEGSEFSVLPSDSLADVVSQMIEKKRRCAVVNIDGQPSFGFVSEWGLINAVLNDGKSLSKTKVSEVANLFIPQIPITAPVILAAQMMLGLDYHQLCVMDEKGRFLGVVSMQDIIRETAEHNPEVLCTVVPPKSPTLHELEAGS